MSKKIFIAFIAVGVVIGTAVLLRAYLFPCRSVSVVGGETSAFAAEKGVPLAVEASVLSVGATSDKPC